MEEPIEGTGTEGIAPNVSCDRFSDGEWGKDTAHVPGEIELTIYVNSKELVTILCTPGKLNCLVLGFLYTEGIISSTRDVASMRVCEDDSLADVTLTDTEFELPTLRTLTSGCGGGVTFKNKAPEIISSFTISPAEILSLMKQFQQRMELYRLCGGVHTSALADTENILVVAEDIGRHNTLDKIQGECLLSNLPTKDRILITTGRVSSEMLLKAVKMQSPVIVSRTSATGRAISIAHDLGIALVGYARSSRLIAYSHPERLGCST